MSELAVVDVPSIHRSPASMSTDRGEYGNPLAILPTGSAAGAGEGLLQAALAEAVGPKGVAEAGSVEEVGDGAARANVLLLQARAGDCICDLCPRSACARELRPRPDAAHDVGRRACTR